VEYRLNNWGRLSYSMNPPAIYLKQFQIKEAIELSLVTSWFDLELSIYYINVKVAMSKKDLGTQH
jgi:hypothetical protein